MEDLVNTEVLGLTAEIIAAHVGHNQVAAADLPAMIQSVYRSLANVGLPVTPRHEAPTPAVSINRSVFPDYIVCLEDGKTLKMLKRHLQTSYGLTPADYRAKWGLPPDYPMVAPSYASTGRASPRASALDGSDRLCRVNPVRLSRPNPSTIWASPRSPSVKPDGRPGHGVKPLRHDRTNRRTVATMKSFGCFLAYESLRRSNPRAARRRYGVIGVDLG